MPVSLLDFLVNEEEEHIFCPLEIEKWGNRLIKLKFGKNDPISIDTYSLIGYVMMFVFYRVTMKHGDLYTNMYSLVNEDTRKNRILEYRPIISVCDPILQA